MAKPAENDATKLYAIFAFATIIVGLGLPVWWKTTQTYRVPLPYDRISRLSLDQWQFEIVINVILPTSGKNDQYALKAELEASMLSQNTFVVQELLNVLYKVQSIDSTRQKLIESCSTFEEVDLQWMSIQGPSHSFDYDIVVLPATVPFPRASGIYISRHRLILVKETETSLLASKIRSIAENILARKVSLQDNTPSFINRAAKKNRHDRWVVGAAPVYDVTFSLVVPEPDVLQVSWNIEQGIQALQLMMDKLSLASRFDLQSQILYFLPLGVKTSYDQKRNAHRLTQEQLPHMINSLEEKLGSHITVHPSLHFIVYVPKKSESPLHIYDAAGQQSEANSFFSPRWGGIFIYNSNEIARNSNVSQIDVDIQTTMSIVVSELRVFLGLNQGFCDEAFCQELDASFLCDWEVDFVVRRHTTEYLLTTANTLRSLSALLEEIGNIVINDEVGNFVLEAVDAYEQCLFSLRQNRPEDALVYAKNAYIASEKAFFDPSMLALLYFPEDQKYAVYVPLFLPVSVPIILSLLHVLKMWKKKSKQE